MDSQKFSQLPCDDKRIHADSKISTELLPNSQLHCAQTSFTESNSQIQQSNNGINNIQLLKENTREMMQIEIILDSCSEIQQSEKQKQILQTLLVIRNALNRCQQLTEKFKMFHSQKVQGINSFSQTVYRNLEQFKRIQFNDSNKLSETIKTSNNDISLQALESKSLEQKINDCRETEINAMSYYLELIGGSDVLAEKVKALLKLEEKICKLKAQIDVNESESEEMNQIQQKKQDIQSQESTMISTNEECILIQQKNAQLELQKKELENLQKQRQQSLSQIYHELIDNKKAFLRQTQSQLEQYQKKLKLHEDQLSILAGQQKQYQVQVDFHQKTIQELESDYRRSAHGHDMGCKWNHPKGYCLWQQGICAQKQAHILSSINQLKQKHQPVTTHIQQAGNQISEQRNEINQLKKQILELQKQYKQDEQQLYQLQNQLDIERDQENCNNRKQLEALESQIEQEQARIAIYQARISEILAKIKIDQTQLKRLLDIQFKKQQEIKQNLSITSNQYEQLKKKLKNFQDNLPFTIEEYKQISINLQTCILNLVNFSNNLAIILSSAGFYENQILRLSQRTTQVTQIAMISEEAAEKQLLEQEGNIQLFLQKIVVVTEPCEVDNNLLEQEFKSVLNLPFIDLYEVSDFKQTLSQECNISEQLKQKIFQEIEKQKTSIKEKQLQKQIASILSVNIDQQRQTLEQYLTSLQMSK